MINNNNGKTSENQVLQQNLKKKKLPAEKGAEKLGKSQINNCNPGRNPLE